MEHQKSAQYLQIGLVCFFVLLVVCILIRPSGLGANGGISYYGAYGNTLLPYSMAFLVNSALIWRAASIMDSRTKIDYYFKLGLYIFAILSLGVLLTPDHFLDGMHVTIGSTLFSLQLIMGATLALFIYRDWKNLLLLFITFASGLASLVFLLHPNGFMIQSQIIFQISVWLIFIRFLYYSDVNPDKKINSI